LVGEYERARTNFFRQYHILHICMRPWSTRSRNVGSHLPADCINRCLIFRRHSPRRPTDGHDAVSPGHDVSRRSRSRRTTATASRGVSPLAIAVDGLYAIRAIVPRCLSDNSLIFYFRPSPIDDEVAGRVSAVMRFS